MQALFKQTHPHINKNRCFLVYMTLLKGFNFDLEMFSAVEFFVSLSFTGVIEPIWLERQAVNFEQFLQFA